MKQPSAPITATHRDIQFSHVCYRVTGKKYAQVYLFGRWFCSTITNEDLLTTKRTKFVTLLPTGFKRFVANVFQLITGSSYRVKKFKIN